MLRLADLFGRWYHRLRLLRSHGGLFGRCLGRLRLHVVRQCLRRQLSLRW